jgi:hypothetical protein
MSGMICPNKTSTRKEFEMFKLNSRMTKAGIALLLLALMIFIPLSVALAAQPGVECEDVRPGHAEFAPGSAFNPDGQAGTVYAGEQPQNSNNVHSVSQYDVACVKIPQP